MTRPSLPVATDGIKAAGITPSLLARMGQRDFGLAAGAFLVVALLLGFGLLADEVIEGGTARFDLAVLTALRTGKDLAIPIGPAWVQETGRDVTALGSFVFLGFLSAATVGYLMLVRKRDLAMVMVAAVLGGTIASTLLKYGIDRPRPDFPNAVRVFTPGFPSGHATLATVTFLTLGVLLTRGSADRRVKSYFMGLSVFLTVAVGLSRIYLGVHYPSDVLAGWCVGAAWAVSCWILALWLQSRGKIEREGAEAAPARSGTGTEPELSR
ncbi:MULTISPECIES: phosphatase PAP2 family protein [unclassified Methylobacterium]|uniref:phosphatase PAP2 family protein n=1 Tax=unclassified Methylobacterium TaxID=2615210 RepID=UPI0011C203B3|nr:MULTISPECIES: phosphatase PAP2 family protein [unclassified Methylobacterium]QEE39898.1 phosphatase PAP2 family protein [Methylobacterium sp. WL1]TXN55936.1 phosphatase PAP2 family protein [Methylobacterium sp. WL2]